MRRDRGPQRHGDRGRTGEQRSAVVSRNPPVCRPSFGFSRHHNMGSGSSHAWPPTLVRPCSFPTGRDGTPGSPWRPGSLLRMMAHRKPLPILCCHGIGTRSPVPDSHYPFSFPPGRSIASGSKPRPSRRAAARNGLDSSVLCGAVTGWACAPRVVGYRAIAVEQPTDPRIP